jgi:hypothetical protein
MEKNEMAQIKFGWLWTAQINYNYLDLFSLIAFGW